MSAMIGTRECGIDHVSGEWWGILKSGFLKILAVILVVSIPVDIILLRIPVNFPAGTYGVQSPLRHQQIYRMLEARDTNPPSSGQLQGIPSAAQAANLSLSPAATLNLTAPVYGWSKTWGGSASGAQTNHIVADGLAICYVTGEYTGTVAFNPSGGDSHASIPAETSSGPQPGGVPAGTRQAMCMWPGGFREPLISARAVESITAPRLA